MSSFWVLSTGELPSGTAEASHTKDFTVIPDGTMAPALIKDFKLESPNQSYQYPFYDVLFKLTSGDFKGREVHLKIKCFDEKPTVRDRNINMMKRVYELLAHKPTHSDSPKNEDLQPMIGKILGVKISEWTGTNSKTGEPTNGNYVSECHTAGKDFETVTGTKLEVSIPPRVETAFSRNSQNGLPLDDSGIPF
jgi:hypothetical protein